MNTQSVCLGCAAELPPPFLDLGNTPLANSYVDPRETAPEARFRLAVVYCPHCHLVQLTDLVPPEEMFSNYLYFSSFSESYLAHARAMADSLAGRLQLGAGSLVMEIASNDGYLLQYFQQRGIGVLGVEPAGNIAAVARERGIPTVSRFFGQDAASGLREEFGAADLIIGNNVLAHVPGVNGFLAGVKHCLKPDGCAVFEFPHLKELLDKSEFDTIYHEHVFYYSLHAIRGLAARAGLTLFDVEPQRVHGGSLRVFLSPDEAREPSSRVREVLAQERTAGLLIPRTYFEWGARVRECRGALRDLLSGLKAEGKRLAAYGAPAKGNTLLNYCGIGTELLEFTVDRSPHKQGLLLPGSRLPILAPETLAREAPDYTVILPWNLAEEIQQQQAEYVARGGRFIVPVPSPKVVDSSEALVRSGAA